MCLPQVAVDGVSGLFIGSYGAANNLDALKQAGSRTSYAFPRRSHCSELEGGTVSGCRELAILLYAVICRFPDEFTYLRLEVADLPSVRISDFFDEALGFVDT